MFETIGIAGFIWLVAGVVFTVLEFAVPGVITIFFGFGAILTGILSAFLNISLNSQIFIFLGSSLLSLALLRKYLKNVFVGFKKKNSDPVDSLSEHVGKKATVRTKISPSKQGTVLYNGTVWEAESIEDIEEGDTVQIIGLDSIVLKVIKID